MTADVIAVVISVAVPIAAAAALVGLVTGLDSLERSREDLIGLDQERR